MTEGTATIRFGAPNDEILVSGALDKELLRNRFAILLSRTNHLSYHIGQAALVRQ